MIVVSFAFSSDSWKNNDIMVSILQFSMKALCSQFCFKKKKVDIVIVSDSGE